jgi:hypothetical protein
MKTLLILTGPQGSGNHLWSKIFALHPAVNGWSALLNEYWIGHDQEPYAEYWRNTDLIKTHNWGTHNYYVTSVSTPYMNNGTPTIPNFKEFAIAAQNSGLAVKIAVLGRDQNILQHQQSRVRGAHTVSQALAEFDQFAAPVFLSYELLHLYGKKYLESVEKQLNFPIAVNDPRLNNILIDDTNQKYFQPVEYHPTDDLAKHASRKHT